MPEIDVGSDLQYEITAPTTLLLNVAIAATDHQQIVSESLTITPAVPEIGRASCRERV